ncbi:MAG: response regulator [Balneolaceae bacterium]
MLNKILCVEDDQLLHLFLKKMVDKTDFADEIIDVYNGREALDYYRDLSGSVDEQSPDYPELIFLDLKMPVMGGLKFLDEFEKLFLDKFSRTNVVILTSYLVKQEREIAEQHPFVLDYLTKPLTFEKLNELKIKLSSPSGQ